MNPKVLERLITDRSFGELSPDSAELLAAYLEVAHEHEADVDALRDTIDLARQALGAGQPEKRGDLPPPRFVDRLLASPLKQTDSARPRARPNSIVAPPSRRWKLGRDAHATQRLGRILRHATVAASLILAFWIGNRMGSPADERAPTGARMIPPARYDVSSAHESGFWSIARFRSSHRARPDRRRQEINWTSPLKRPRIGEQS